MKKILAILAAAVVLAGIMLPVHSAAAQTPTITWSIKASMLAPRRHAASATIGDKIYIVSGETGHCGFTTRNEVHDASTNTWSTLAPLSLARSRFAAVTYGDKIYAIAGAVSCSDPPTNSLEIYDIATDTWTAGATMAQRRYQHGAAVVGEKIYVMGGNMADGSGCIDTMEVYDIASGTWSPGTSLPSPDCGKAVAIGNEIYFLGGLGNLYKYDTLTESWSLRASLPDSRGVDGSGLEVYQGNLYVVSPPHYNYPGNTPLDDVEIDIYDPATDGWTRVEHSTPWVSPRFAFATGIVGNSLFIMGGDDDGAAPSHVYDINEMGTIVAGPPLADTPWPMFHHDPQHTGRSPYSGPTIPPVQKWKYDIGGYGELSIISSPSIGADGTIYIGSGDSGLLSINPDGTLKWSYPTGGNIRSSPAIAADGTIYVGCTDNKLYAINPGGTLKWTFTDAGGGGITSSPLIGPDGTIYFGSWDRNLYALNPSDGSSKWSNPYTDGSYISSSPAISADGATIFIATYANKAHGVKAADGTAKWTTSFDQTGPQSGSSPAIGSDGTVYIGSDDHHLYALDPSDGSQKSFSPYTAGHTATEATIGYDSTIYLSCSDGKLYALDPDFDLKWTYSTGGATSSATIGADGTIYFGSSDGKLYAVNPNGTLKWSYDTGSPIYSRPAIGSDGTIYIHSYNNGLFALTDGTTYNTPTGSNVTVSLPEAVVTFNSVTTAGTTTVTTQQGNPGGEIPSGFRVRGLFVDVTTDAIYSPPVTVGIPYDPSEPNPQNLKLFHGEGGHWVDVTTWADTTNHIVYGEVNSLSWFFIGGEWVWVEGAGVPVFPNVYIGIAAAVGAGILAYLLRRRLVRQG